MAFVPALHAAEVQLGVRAFAQDSSANVSDFRIDGGNFSAPPVGSATAMFTAGLASSYAHVEGDALNGTLRADFKARVDDDRYIVGRNANANGVAALVGSITLSGAAPSGLATFTAVVEGAYTFNNLPANYQNDASLAYSGVVGDTSRDGTIYFDPRTLAGLFAVPLTFTQTVHPGDRIDMFFYMRGNIDALLGAVELDVSNTFRLTGIDLPPGYSYTSDAQGFLSQFPLPAVPEPASGALLALALPGMLLWARRRAPRRRPD